MRPTQLQRLQCVPESPVKLAVLRGQRHAAELVHGDGFRDGSFQAQHFAELIGDALREFGRLHAEIVAAPLEFLANEAPSNLGSVRARLGNPARIDLEELDIQRRDEHRRGRGQCRKSRSEVLRGIGRERGHSRQGKKCQSAQAKDAPSERGALRNLCVDSPRKAGRDLALSPWRLLLPELIRLGNRCHRLR